jgi:hypothetical protein
MISPTIADASVANRGGGYAVESGEMGISDACRPDKMDFHGVEPSSGSIRGRDRYRKYVSWLVAGARFGAIQLASFASAIRTYARSRVRRYQRDAAMDILSQRKTCV